MSEVQKSIPVDYRYVDRLADLYVTFRKRYVSMMPGKAPFVPKNKTHEPVALNNGAMIRHLAREHAVCIFAGPKAAKFLCFDVDEGGVETALRIADAAERLGVPRDAIALSTSGRKGFHVDIFFDRPVLHELRRRVYDNIIAELGLSPKKVEFRPTDTQSIKLPLSIHPATHAVCWYLDRETGCPIHSLDPLFEIKPMSGDAFDRIATELKPVAIQMPEKKPAAAPAPSENILDADGNAPDLTEEGMRYKTMRAIAVYERNRGTGKEELMGKLAAWVERQPPEFIDPDSYRIQSDIRGLADWVFSEKFYNKSAKSDISLSPKEMAAIVVQPTKARRRLYFYATIREKQFGVLFATANRIGDYIGSSGQYVTQHLLPSLVAEGWLDKKPTGYQFANGMVYRGKNRYRTRYPISLRDVESTLRGATVRGRIAPENFGDAYLTAMRDAIPEEERKKYLTKSEIERMSQIVQRDIA